VSRPAPAAEEEAQPPAPRPFMPSPVRSTPSPAPSTRSASALKTILPLVGLLAVAGGVGYFWYTHSSGDSAPPGSGSKATPGAEKVPAETADASASSNFTNHDSAMLFIKQTN